MMYCVKLDRKDALEVLVNNSDKNGVFVVWSSSISPECLALSFVNKLSVHRHNEVRHKSNGENYN